MFAPAYKSIGQRFITVAELARLRNQCGTTVLRMVRDGRLPMPERVLGYYVWDRDMQGLLLAVPAQKNRRPRVVPQADESRNDDQVLSERRSNPSRGKI
jgi:hypothetical protein